MSRRAIAVEDVLLLQPEPLIEHDLGATLKNPERAP